jgi:inner membrane protein
MLFKTHLMFGIFAILLMISFVNNKIVFVIVAFIATIIPDIDHSDSKIGRKLIFRPFQFFVKHRGMTHSFTIALLVSILIAMFFPVASFGFFLGYSVHLFCDSFTREGIEPFWPFDHKTKGYLTTGEKYEEILFVFMMAVDLVLFAIIIYYNFG